MNINQYLNEHENKSLLRILTCGSVDDGKSTLIGRLLYDSKLIFEDQLAALQKDSDKNGTTGAGEIDYALLLDGLKAEREQGITIDVAYRYFATPKRKFIIADCPGHEQYTRNMATGASTADLAIILIDARYGVITQTRRHSFIVSLLGIRNVVVAVNKMDLVDYSVERFEGIRDEFLEFAKELDIPHLSFIPLSALKGVNVVAPDRTLTPYYTGPALLEHLETVDIGEGQNLQDFRYSIQHVIRPNLDFRGFAGTVGSGVIKVDDHITVLPSGKQSRIKEIVTYDGTLDYAFASQAVTLTLTDEIDASCGDWIVKSDNLPLESTVFRANLIWMTQQELRPGDNYLLHHGSSFVKARVKEISRRINVNTLERENADTLPLNGIAEVVVEVTKPLFFDPYRKNRATGRFILIDLLSNATAGAGMIIDEVKPQDLLPSRLDGLLNGNVTPQARITRQRHRGAVVLLAGPSAATLAAALEEKLFALHINAYALSPNGRPDGRTAALGVTARAFADSGAIFITALSNPDEIRHFPETSLAISLDGTLPGAQLELGSRDDLGQSAAKIIILLTAKHYLPDTQSWTYAI